MLPPFIIEQIRQREEREQRKRDDASRPRIQLPLDHGPVRTTEANEDDEDRGVVVVDLLG